MIVVVATLAKQSFALPLLNENLGKQIYFVIFIVVSTCTQFFCSFILWTIIKNVYDELK
jgi:hypothetical protein